MFSSVLTKFVSRPGLRSLCRSYRAAVLKEFAKPLVIEEKNPRKLAKSEVRVQVYSCSVNASDVLTCQGVYENPPALPFVPGFEFSGEVLEVGSSVDSVCVGGRVIGLLRSGSGAFSEQVVADASELFGVDNAVEFGVAASLLDNYCTAALAFSRRVSLLPEHVVLVTAAAGGLGLAAVDLAANVYKSKVIAVCDTEDRAALVRERGAFAALSHDAARLADSVRRVTSSRGVDVVFDAAGGDVFHACLPCVCHEGNVIVAGFASRTVPSIATSVLLPKSFALIGLSLRHFRACDNAVFNETAREVVHLYERGLISPHVSAQYSLQRCNDALSFIDARRSTGKVLLDIR